MAADQALESLSQPVEEERVPGGAARKAGADFVEEREIPPAIEHCERLVHVAGLRRARVAAVRAAVGEGGVT